MGKDRGIALDFADMGVYVVFVERDCRVSMSMKD